MHLFGSRSPQSNKNDNPIELTKDIFSTFVSILVNKLQEHDEITSEVLCGKFLQLQTEVLLPTLQKMVAKQHIQSIGQWHNLMSMYYINMYSTLTKLHQLNRNISLEVAVDFIQTVQENAAFRSFINHPQNGIRPNGLDIAPSDPLPVKYILPFLHSWPTCIKSFKNKSVSPKRTLSTLALFLRDHKNHRQNLELLTLISGTELNLDSLKADEVKQLLAQNLVPQTLLALPQGTGLVLWFDQFAKDPHITGMLPNAETIVFYFLHEIDLWSRQLNSFVNLALAELNWDARWRVAKKYLEIAAKDVMQRQPEVAIDVATAELFNLTSTVFEQLFNQNYSLLSPEGLADITNFVCTSPWNQYLAEMKLPPILFAEFTNKPEDEYEKARFSKRLCGFLSAIQDGTAPQIINLLQHHWETVVDKPVILNIIANPALIKNIDAAPTLIYKFQTSIKNLNANEIQDVIARADKSYLGKLETLIRTKDELVQDISNHELTTIACLKRGLLWAELFQLGRLPLSDKLSILEALILSQDNPLYLGDLINRLRMDLLRLCSGNSDALLSQDREKIYSLLRQFSTKKVQIPAELWDALTPVLESPIAIFNLIGMSETGELSQLDTVPPILSVLLQLEKPTQWFIQALRTQMTNKNIAWLLQKMPIEVIRSWILRVPELSATILNNPELANQAFCLNISAEFSREIVSHVELFTAGKWCAMLPTTKEASVREALLANLKTEMRLIPAAALIDTFLEEGKTDFIIALYERFNSIEAMQVLHQKLKALSSVDRFNVLRQMLPSNEFLKLTRTFWATPDLPILELLKDESDNATEDTRLLNMYLMPIMAASQTRYPHSAPLERLDKFASEPVLTAVTQTPNLRRVITKKLLTLILIRPKATQGIDQISQRHELLMDKEMSSRMSTADWIEFLNNEEINADLVLFDIARYCLSVPALKLKELHKKITPERRHWLLAVVMEKLTNAASLKENDLKIYQAYLKEHLTQDTSLIFYSIHALPTEVFEFLHHTVSQLGWVKSEYMLGILNALDQAPLQRVEKVLKALSQQTITEIYDDAATIVDEQKRGQVLTMLACSVTLLKKLNVLDHVSRQNKYPPRAVVLAHIAKLSHFPNASSDQPNKNHAATDSSYCRILVQNVNSSASLTHQEMSLWLNLAKNPPLSIFYLLLPALNKEKPVYFLRILIDCPKLSIEMTIEIMRTLVEHYHVDLAIENLMREAQVPKNDVNYKKIEYCFARARNLFQENNKILTTDLAIEDIQDLKKYLDLAKMINDIQADKFVAKPEYVHCRLTAEIECVLADKPFVASPNSAEKAAEKEFVFVPRAWVAPLEQYKKQLRLEQNSAQQEGGLIVSEIHCARQNKIGYLPSLAELVARSNDLEHAGSDYTV